MSREFNFKVADETVTIAEFYRKIRNRLPAIFRVELGNLGATNFDEFGGGDVVYVNNESVQMRMAAKDSEHRIFSIPVEGRHIYHIVEGHDKVGRMIRMDEILKRKLPVNVKITDPNTYNNGVRIVRDSHMSDEKVPNMLLFEEYESLLLLGHTIDSTKGKPFDRPVYVPLHLDMTVKHCIGFENRPPVHWEAYLEYLEDFTKDMKYDRTVGFEEIIECKLKEIEAMKALRDATYDYIEVPLLWSKEGMVSRGSREEIEKIKKSFVTLHSRPDNWSPNDEPPPPLPARSISVQKPNKKGDQKERKMSNGGVLDELSKVIGTRSKDTGKGDETRQSEKNVSQVGEESGSTDRSPDASLKKSHNGSGKYEYLEAKKKPGKDNSYASFPNGGKSTTQVPSQTSPSTTVLRDRDKSQKSIPSSVDSPSTTVLRDRDKSQKSTPSSVDTTQMNRISALTIDDVSSKLDALHLNQYADKFKKECVDGQILLHLDEQILKDDFNLRGIEAVRLMTFIRKGHIPK